ncbi:MAG: dTMP kinase [Thermoplasmata archaeon]|nr:MAG: dTMP kinase [Thermoplasmata archaeon]RLF67412.1 MAG: dTMP kinase [Thermoplasmata archaeon]
MSPFIVIEGIDGSGKGTQARLLKERLEDLGRNVVLTSEPTKGPIGKMIREHLSNPFLDDESLSLLFAADRIEHLEKEIRPIMSPDTFIISDRYVYSSIAYQGQKVDMEWVGEINKYADRPDLAILLDIDPKLGERRMRDRGDELEYFEEDRSFQEDVRKAFLHLSRGQNQPESLKTKWLVIDAALDKSEIQDRIWDVVSNMV